MPQGDQRDLLTAVANSADRLRNIKIKDIRTLICVILGSDKPQDFYFVKLLDQCLRFYQVPASAFGNKLIGTVTIACAWFTERTQTIGTTTPSTPQLPQT
jgi:hypothetical protein